MQPPASPVTGVLAELPKAELHVHLEGCLEPAMALAFARRNSIDYQYASIEEIVAALEFEDLADFCRVMQTNSVTLVTERDFYDLTYGYLRRAHHDNIVHAEMAMSPQGPQSRGIPLEMVIESVIAAFEDAHRDFGMTGGIVVACLRHLPPEDGMAMLAQLTPYRDKILALGLHGPERGYPPAPFARHFARARDMGWHTVAHAGEEGPADHIWQALDLLQVERIDHGVACDKDTALLKRLAEERIPLTVCPISNVRLGVFPSLESHNLPKLVASGLHVSLHSDDPAYFGGYINDHLGQILASGLCTEAEAVQLIANGFEAAFMPDDRKAMLMAACQSAGAKMHAN